MQTNRLCFVLSLVVLAAPAGAEELCNKPLRMVDSLKLSPAGKNDPRFTLPAIVNGQPADFLFDTGGALPSISAELADSLKLKRRDSDIQLYGVSGSRADRYAVVEFSLGRIVRAPSAQIIVSDTNILTPAFMGKFDFEFDAVNAKLNVFSGDHCAGQVIYWPYKAATAVSYTVDFNSHIVVPVTVDGKDFSAIIDTGASTSTMRLDLATYVFGLKPDSPGMEVVARRADDEKFVYYHYPFKSLTFGDITVRNPKIVILPDLMAKNADKNWGWAGGHITAPPENLKLPQIIIGMDVLSKLHVYFAQGERKLYITDADAPAAATPQTISGQ